MDTENADQTTGRCLCGAVRFKFDPDAVKWTCNCYCESCRRATGAPVSTFISVRDTGWRWLGEMPAVYESSPGVRRSFCPVCGTSLTYAAEKVRGETHFLAANLIDPSAVHVDFEYAKGERLHWADLEGDLPQK